MSPSCDCPYSSTCRIFEVYAASEKTEDAQFIRNCCYGPERDYCPIHRYHAALRHPSPSGHPGVRVPGRIDNVDEQSFP